MFRVQALLKTSKAQAVLQKQFRRSSSFVVVIGVYMPLLLFRIMFFIFWGVLPGCVWIAREVNTHPQG